MSAYVLPYSVIFARFVPAALIAVLSLAVAALAFRALLGVVMTSPRHPRVASSLLTTIALGLVIAFIVVVSAVFSTAAEARPSKHSPQKNHRVVRDVTPLFAATFDIRALTPNERAEYYQRGRQGQQPSSAAPRGAARRDRRHAEAKSFQASTGASIGLSLGGGSLVATARSYIGTNPTGRRSLWCGAFMDVVLKRTGHAPGGLLASAYAHYGTRVAGPQVGAIAVMGRRGGGHVGIVSGVDANGNPIIISGNTWSRASGGRSTVLEQSYSRSRVYAYVLPR